VTGVSPAPGANHDYATVAYDASTGSTLWVRRYDGPVKGSDAANAVVASPDGSAVYVTGESEGHSHREYATIAYAAATGAVLWARRYTAGRSDSANALATSADGSMVVVTGLSAGDGTSYDYATVAYDAATGEVRWVRRYDGAGDSDRANAIAVSPDGSRVLVIGESRAETSFDDFATIAYDSSTGVVLWSRRYSAPGRGKDEALVIAQTPDGSTLFVAGTSTGDGLDYDVQTIAYEA
jgi:PQQ-like domain